MKVSKVFSAYKHVLGRQLAYLMWPDSFPKPKPNDMRKVSAYEFWLDKHIPAMEQELAEKSRWLHNLDTARGGYSYQQMNLKERKAFLETKRENRRHLRRIRVLEAELELPRKLRANLAESLGRLSAENERLREANTEMHYSETIFREIITTLQNFTHARPNIFFVGDKVDESIVEYATKLEKELAAYKGFFTTPGDVWGNRDRWLKGQQK